MDMKQHYPRRYDRLSGLMTFLMSMNTASLHAAMVSAPLFVMATLTKTMNNAPAQAVFSASCASLSLACVQNLFTRYAAKHVSGKSHEVLFRKAHKWGKVLGYAAPGTVAMSFAAYALSGSDIQKRDSSDGIQAPQEMSCPSTRFKMVEDEYKVSEINGFDWKCGLFSIRKP